MDKKLMGLVLAIVAAGAIGFSVFGTDSTETVPQVEQGVETAQETAEAQPEITIAEDGNTVAYAGQEGETALATAKALTEVTTEDSDFGEFVTGINGVTADADSEYWAFYVNGELASEGAGTYVSAKDDKIEWKLESF